MGKTVIVLASHPDDAELGMGGTIAALCAAGHTVILVDLTDGEPTPHGTPQLRQVESQRAAGILKVSERITLDIKNREIFDTVANREKVATILRRYKPELVCTHYWEDSHPDHVAASALSDAARFYAKFVKTSMPYEPHLPRRMLYYFGIHLRPTVTPSFVFDISPHMDTKLAAVNCYESQFGVNSRNQSVRERIRIDAAFWGAQIGVAFGEPFILREQLGLRSPQSLIDV